MFSLVYIYFRGTDGGIWVLIGMGDFDVDRVRGILVLIGMRGILVLIGMGCVCVVGYV